MKQNKVRSLDTKLIDDLKEVNASKLLNELLLDYFNKNGHLKREQIEAKITAKQAEEQTIKEEVNLLILQLKEITEKEAKMKEIFGDIPQEILDDFKDFTKMTSEILMQRFKNIYRERYPELKRDRLLRAFQEFKDGKFR